MIRKAALLSLVPLFSGAPAQASCPGSFAVEVLGSGGPIADSARASSSYIVWRDGEARLLVDAGGGAFLRFAQAGADFNTLDAILISHFHADHVSDLPAILKSGSFGRGDKKVTIAGPSGNQYFPGLHAFMASLFAPGGGAFQYLSSYVEGPKALDQIEVAADGASLQKIFEGSGLTVEAVPVNHGDTPALAFRVTADNRSVVFAGDQSALSDAFDASLEGSAPALLIAHHAISEAPGQPRGLHRPPSSIGEMAAGLGAKRLVLSHNMKRALDARREDMKIVATSFSGKVEIAGDHACYRIVR